MSLFYMCTGITGVIVFVPLLEQPVLPFIPSVANKYPTDWGVKAICFTSLEVFFVLRAGGFYLLSFTLLIFLFLFNLSRLRSDLTVQDFRNLY